jgi:hypothetical protein
VESPGLNAELLIGHALGLKRMQLYLQFERPLTEIELEKIRPLVRRRGQREPLQYILGETEFAAEVEGGPPGAHPAAGNRTPGGTDLPATPGRTTADPGPRNRHRRDRPGTGATLS